MVPTPYSRLAGDAEDAGLQQQQQQGDAAPLPAQPPILFGSTTSLPSSTASFWDDLEGKDRFDAEDDMEDGREGGGPSHWRARPSSKVRCAMSCCAFSSLVRTNDVPYSSPTAGAPL